MLINDIHLNEINSPKQTIRARVEIHKGSALEKICTCNDILSEFTMERMGEGKFFGYGICQKLRVNLLDIDRELNLTKENTLEASFGVNGNFIYPFPIFHITEIDRDETTNSLSITAHDLLYEAENHTITELNLSQSYDIRTCALACAAFLRVPLRIENIDDGSFDTFFDQGANFEGTEDIRTVLNAIAEATQSIYFINKDWELTFKRLDKNAVSAITIDKDHYVALENSGPAILGKAIHVTTLGDNVESNEPTTAVEGVVQHIRDNPFWELREDIGTLVDNAQAAVGGISINQFECEWMGNYLLEIGDRISLIAEDNSIIDTYILDDSITFDGTLLQHTKWEYKTNDNETAANPSSLGEVLNQTYARVDKVNQEILLVATQANTNRDEISSLKVTSSNIEAKVTRVENNVSQSNTEINNKYNKLEQEVSTKMSAEDVQIAINSTLSNGVDSVTTTTGFTFNKDGLTVKQSDKEVSTNINADGMVVSKNDIEELLVADSDGVRAKNLRATTYLIIGYSHFENQGNRTACFWVGDQGGK